MFERELAIANELMDTLRDPVDRLHDTDPGLATYMRRAAYRLSITLDEARWEEAGEQDRLLMRAEEYVAELFGALNLAESWGLIETPSLNAARMLLDAELVLLGRTPARVAN
jgi:hypothetical protein